MKKSSKWLVIISQCSGVSILALILAKNLLSGGLGKYNEIYDSLMPAGVLVHLAIVNFTILRHRNNKQ